ncbi:hypothetical protein FRB96_008198 [Tulasnella sp. 330]|nr:hypothetical protein FRB96_008198 [Tulasnella sp. 330]KAG8876084.1 hypothetical protein FRB97_004472 [Tulasnella sp. 331]KAG8887236.1 hypothetical protein FRB98_000333 [Tulasnella sp. 332]
MASTVQAAKDAVTGAVAAASNAATSAISAATSTAPPTAPHTTNDGSGAVPTGDETAAPVIKDEAPLLNPQDELAKERLQKLLGERPERQELVDKNILKSSNVAPGLQAKQAELARSQLEDLLENKLQARPRPEELVKEGILQSSELAAAE